MARPDDLKKLNELIQGIRFAMLTTIDDDGSLRARPMATQETEFDGEVLWFFTYGGSAKAAEVRRDNRDNVGFSDNDGNRWVSLSGQGQIVRDRAKSEELWNPILKTWSPTVSTNPTSPRSRSTFSRRSIGTPTPAPWSSSSVS